MVLRLSEEIQEIKVKYTKSKKSYEKRLSMLENIIFKNYTFVEKINYYKVLNVV